MSVFRPSNINKRLVGTATTATGGSPGNAGQIGPTKTPYCTKGTCAATLCLGCRFFNGGGNKGGVFRINESRCGRKECCNCPSCDCKGFFICCGPSTTKWFVAPVCAEVYRNWYDQGDAVTQANSCMGCCSWFVPDINTAQNPGFCCRIYWDTNNFCYWTSSESHDFGSPVFNMGQGCGPGANAKGHTKYVRAFRCGVT